MTHGEFFAVSFDVRAHVCLLLLDTYFYFWIAIFFRVRVARLFGIFFLFLCSSNSGLIYLTPFFPVDIQLFLLFCVLDFAFVSSAISCKEQQV